ncbi:murein hydrolase activator EnvC family protein [Halalkalibacterium ligniniphilum]|uniref:murein hydrolase activator EnvC family protein n=1 Tax=Halalkalibacterium ligniniphilum TaxID=1134413 RepID=UPI000347A116|nr:peptidoglycan DD-metalloendopeptidase family protein [Halalkalibacterium ligniniphilum]
MRRKVGLLAVATLVAASTLLSEANLAFANPSLENQISDVQRERQEKQSEAKQKEEEIHKVEQEMDDIGSEIEKIDHEVAETSQKVRNKRAEIEEVQNHIEQLKEEIVILEERIAERDELLKERARSMYQNGGSVNYLEVILGAKSFGDFLDRVSALSVIAQQDRNILDAHIQDQRQLEETKTLVEEELQKLEGHLVELEELMAQLEEQRKEKDRLMARLQERENELHADLGELEDADRILRQQEAALKQELEAYKERQRQAAEREEAERQRQAAQAQTSRSTGPSHSAPAVSNSGFMMPATGTITSHWGPRATFGGRMHYGIDIGKNGRTGDVPVVAVYDGTVIRSYYSESYGNTVLIAHNLNGQSITTLYAHLEDRRVFDGQRVSKGQVLGNMGNTGRSYGPHLHFEVHEGSWNQAKSNAVNPMKYLP